MLISKDGGANGGPEGSTLRDGGGSLGPSGRISVLPAPSYHEQAGALGAAGQHAACAGGSQLLLSSPHSSHPQTISCYCCLPVPHFFFYSCVLKDPNIFVYY